MRSRDTLLIFLVALKMTYFGRACRLFDPASQATTTPNLMVCTLVEPSVARPTHTGEDCNEPWREPGAAGSGAGVSSRVSRARSPPARLNHFVRNFEEKSAQKNRAPVPSCQAPSIWVCGSETSFFLVTRTPLLVGTQTCDQRRSPQATPPSWLYGLPLCLTYTRLLG